MKQSIISLMAQTMIVETLMAKTDFYPTSDGRKLSFLDHLISAVGCSSSSPCTRSQPGSWNVATSAATKQRLGAELVENDPLLCRSGRSDGIFLPPP